MTTKLISTSFRPFHSKTEDLITGLDDEEEVVVTINTVDFEFKSSYESVSMFDTEDGEDVDKEKVIEKMNDVGITREKSDGIEAFEVVVDSFQLHRKILKEVIGRINKEYNKDFVIYSECSNCNDKIEIDDWLKPSEMDKYPVSNQEQWKLGVVFCSEKCFNEME